MRAARSLSYPSSAPVARSRRPRALWSLTALAAAGVLAGVILALVYAGQDARQGDVQRLFYVHLSSFAGAFAAFGAAAFGGVMYLMQRHPLGYPGGVGGGGRVCDEPDQRLSGLDLGAANLEHLVDERSAHDRFGRHDAHRCRLSGAAAGF